MTGGPAGSRGRARTRMSASTASGATSTTPSPDCAPTVPNFSARSLSRRKSSGTRRDPAVRVRPLSERWSGLAEESRVLSRWVYSRGDSFGAAIWFQAWRRRPQGRCRVPRGLGFTVRTAHLSAFADVTRGPLRLLLSGPTSSGARATPSDTATPGRNRVHLIVDDLDAEIERLRRAGLSFRSDVVEGPGGRQILLADPAGNLIELFTPAS